jgi:hypothetical protein
MAVLIWRLPPRSRRWRLVLPELTGIGAIPPGAGQLGVGGEPLGAGDLADQLAGRERPEARLGEQLRRGLGDELGDLRLEQSALAGTLLCTLDVEIRGALGRGQRVRVQEPERNSARVGVVGKHDEPAQERDRVVEQLVGRCRVEIVGEAHAHPPDAASRCALMSGSGAFSAAMIWAFSRPRLSDELCVRSGRHVGVSLGIGLRSGS